MVDSFSRRSRAKVLKRIMSNSIRHILGLRMLLRWANIEDSEVPDHSNSPLFLETPNVISVGTVFTPMWARKAMKFARWRDISYCFGSWFFWGGYER